MKHDESTLVQRIIASPWDDPARLAYADWLDQNGRADRAAFIREQIASGEELPVATTADTPAPFVAPAGSKCADDVRDLAELGVTAAVFFRGFAECVALSWADWLASSAALQQRGPLREIWLTSWPAYFTKTDGAWVDHADPRFYWMGIPECVASLDLRWPGIRFSIPARAQSEPPLMRVNLEGAEYERTMRLRSYAGQVNSVPFRGHPARSLLFRDIIIQPEGASVGIGSTTCCLLPVRPGCEFPAEWKECDFGEVFHRRKA